MIYHVIVHAPHYLKWIPAGFFFALAVLCAFCALEKGNDVLDRALTTLFWIPAIVFALIATLCGLLAWVF